MIQQFFLLGVPNKSGQAWCLSGWIPDDPVNATASG